MKRKEIKRAYKFSDAALNQIADSLKNKVNRDIADLSAYGVLPATVTDLEDANEAFANTSTDQELMGDMIIATQNKNVLRNSLLTQIRQIADRARIKFGEEDGKFRKFGVELLSKNNDNELVRTANRVARVGTLYLPLLLSEGLSAADITALLAEKTLFDDSIDLQKDTISDRDIAVQERIKLGNALYAIMVNLAAKGKLCYLETDEAKYNDYVLNPSSDSGDTGNTLEGNVAANSVVNISATGITEATVFNIKNTGTTALKFYFAQNPTDTAGLAFILVLSGENRVATTMDLGYNAALNYDRLNANNETPLEGSYEISY